MNSRSVGQVFHHYFWPHVPQCLNDFYSQVAWKGISHTRIPLIILYGLYVPVGYNDYARHIKARGRQPGETVLLRKTWFIRELYHAFFQPTGCIFLCFLFKQQFYVYVFREKISMKTVFPFCNPNRATGFFVTYCHIPVRSVRIFWGRALLAVCCSCMKP